MLLHYLVTTIALLLQATVTSASAVPYINGSRSDSAHGPFTSSASALRFGATSASVSSSLATSSPALAQSVFGTPASIRSITGPPWLSSSSLHSSPALKSSSQLSTRPVTPPSALGSSTPVSLMLSSTVSQASVPSTGPIAPSSPSSLALLPLSSQTPKPFSSSRSSLTSSSPRASAPASSLLPPLPLASAPYLSSTKLSALRSTKVVSSSSGSSILPSSSPAHGWASLTVGPSDQRLSSSFSLASSSLASSSAAFSSSATSSSAFSSSATSSSAFSSSASSSRVSSSSASSSSASSSSASSSAASLSSSSALPILSAVQSSSHAYAVLSVSPSVRGSASSGSPHASSSTVPTISRTGSSPHLVSATFAVSQSGLTSTYRRHSGSLPLLLSGSKSSRHHHTTNLASESESSVLRRRSSESAVKASLSSPTLSGGLVGSGLAASSNSVASVSQKGSVSCTKVNKSSTGGSIGIVPSNVQANSESAHLASSAAATVYSKRSKSVRISSSPSSVAPYQASNGFKVSASFPSETSLSAADQKSAASHNGATVFSTVSSLSRDHSRSEADSVIRKSSAQSARFSQTFATDYTVVSTYTTFCATPTTFTYRSQTVNVSTPTIVTVTDCPCTLTRNSSTSPWTLVPENSSKTSLGLSSAVEHSATLPSRGALSDSATTTISETVATFVTKTLTGSSSDHGSTPTPRVSQKPFQTAQLVLTTTVSTFTTVCNTPTTFVMRSKTYDIRTQTTLTLYNCVLTRGASSSAPWHLIVDTSSTTHGISTAEQTGHQTSIMQSLTTLSSLPFTEASSVVPLLTQTAIGGSRVTATTPPITSSNEGTPTLSVKPSPTSSAATWSEASLASSSIIASSSSTTNAAHTATQRTTFGSSANSFSVHASDQSLTLPHSGALTVVSAFTTYCPTPTTLTFNSKTYTALSPMTLTITDCPCTLTASSVSAPRSSSSAADLVQGSVASHSEVIPSPTISYSGSSSPGSPSELFTVFTTYCASPTTFSVGPSAYTATGPSTFTITRSLLPTSSPSHVYTDTVGTTELASTITSHTQSSGSPQYASFTVFTTFCPGPTTFTVGSQVYTATGPSAYTITESASTVAHTHTGSGESQTSSTDVSRVSQPSPVISVITTTCTGPTTLVWGTETTTLTTSSVLTLTERLGYGPSGVVTAPSTDLASLASSSTGAPLSSSFATSTPPYTALTTASSTGIVTYLTGPATLTAGGTTYVASSATTLTLPGNFAAAPSHGGSPVVPNGLQTAQVSSFSQQSSSEAGDTTAPAPDGTTTIASVIRTRTITRHNTNVPGSPASTGTGASGVALNNGGSSIDASGIMITIALLLVSLV